MQKTHKFDNIIELVRQNDVVLFVGAGFSRKAGAPSTDDLINAFYNKLPIEVQQERGILGEKTLQNVSSAYETHYCRDALTDLLQQLFQFVPQNTEDQYNCAKIPQIKHIFTTNYDSLLENAYGKDKCNVVACDADLANVDKNKTTIYKIHGDFAHKDKIVITKEDYRNYYESQSNNIIWDAVRYEFARHHVLFIGYSLADANIQTIVEFVKRQMGTSSKKMFLIVPDMDSTPAKQLQQKGVEFIQGKAEDFLNELIPEIKGHIVEDCVQRTTSAEDCNQFMRIYDLVPSFELGDSNTPNKLLALRSASGNSIQHTINFTLRGNGKGNPLDQIPTYYDEQLGNLPVKKITDFQDFEFRANDILISHGENVASLSFAPISQKGEISFAIPQKGINASSTCQYFNNWGKCVQINADIDIGIFEIQIPILPNTECGFRFRSKGNKYINNDTAIAWENVFYALFSGCQFIMTLTSEEKTSRSFTYAFKKSKLKNEIKEAKLSLRYYKYIKAIESIRGCHFDEYDKFTEENLFIAEIIYHYLKKEPLKIRHPYRGFEYEVLVTDIFREFDKKQKSKIMESVDNVCCSLNGEEFRIPYMQRIYEQSILKSKKKDERGFYILKFIDKAKEHTILLTDTPLYEERG